MLGIVDYGSSDEDSNEEMELEQPKTSSKILNLPPVVKNPVIKKKKVVVDADEDIPEVSGKRDWEKRLAEEAKNQMKFVKSVKNQDTKKKILAFGLDFQKTEDAGELEEEEELREAQPSVPKSKFKAELLNLLPKPKNPIKKQVNNTKAASVLLPSSLLSKKAPKRPLVDEDVAPGPSRPPPEVVERDSESEEESEDFFGFKSVKTIVPIAIPETVPNSTLSNARIFMDEVASGPARPVQQPEVPAFSSTEELEAALLGNRNINNQQAEALIYQRELAPWGATDNVAREAVMNIVDVSVDEALGPNVRETLLRNLDQKTVLAGPLPNIKAADRVSKQKHQITHLARLAVSRETQLQQQWADSKAKKRATANKYGF